jgi:antitoxin (DNA-binding transcriptional repressor) of toxin-antitoxin stability system
MKTITVRDLCRRWTMTQGTLEEEREITITRHGKPVAKLIRLRKPARKRKRWDPNVHLQWLKKTWGNQMRGSSDAAIARDRADR